MTAAITVGGTGHRPNRFGDLYAVNAWAPAVIALQPILESYLEPGVTVRVISGMSIGFDLALAVSALSLRAKGLPFELVCAIPFEGQDRLWADDAKKLYRQVRSKASGQWIHRMKDGSELLHHERFDALHARNVWIASKCDTLLAAMCDRKSGTGDTVKHCEEWCPGKPIRNCYIEVATALGVPIPSNLNKDQQLRLL